MILLITKKEAVNLLKGAGKRTRIHCLLKELYGSGADTVQLISRNFQTVSGKKLDITCVSSNYHIELTPSDVGIYDRVVVQEIIKQAAETFNLEMVAQKPFKVVVLMEADNLTKDAQHTLRRTMEKYAGSCKLILCCQSVTKVIDPLRSRCMVIRVPAPSDNDISDALKRVVSKEQINVRDRMIEQIVEKSNGNMRRALLLLEATHNQYSAILDTQKVAVPEWEEYLKETAQLMIRTQNPDTLLKVRQRMYEMLCRCIPSEVLFVRLLDELLPNCEAKIRGEVIAAAAKFEHSHNLGSKDIYHLDAFVATFMHIYATNRAGQ
uniref:Replication factor C subunit 3 n=1 Tax=Acrobeloides nanus TaxID=290746 RepID=A0A914CIE9_9BILA